MSHGPDGVTENGLLILLTALGWRAGNNQRFGGTLARVLVNQRGHFVGECCWMELKAEDAGYTKK